MEDLSDEEFFEEEKRTHEKSYDMVEWIDAMTMTYPAGAARAKFEPSSLAGLFLGYALQPGGIPNGDYIVVELANLFNVCKVPTMHQVNKYHANVMAIWGMPCFMRRIDYVLIFKEKSSVMANNGKRRFLGA